MYCLSYAKTCERVFKHEKRNMNKILHDHGKMALSFSYRKISWQDTARHPTRIHTFYSKKTYDTTVTISIIITLPARVNACLSNLTTLIPFVCSERQPPVWRGSLFFTFDFHSSTTRRNKASSQEQQ